MSQPVLQFRPIQPSDYPVIEKMIRKAWDYDRFGSSKLADQLSTVFLSSCLANQTFTSVAVLEEKPVGVIMGKNRKKHRPSLRYLMRLGSAVIQSASSKEGRNIIKTYKEVEKINSALLKHTPVQFDGELSFFVMDEEQRGLGIGKQLYQQFLNYAESESLTTFFLYTDTTCNYGFYEHQGLCRLGEEALYLPKLKENIHFYLYGKI